VAVQLTRTSFTITGRPLYAYLIIIRLKEISSFDNDDEIKLTWIQILAEKCVEQCRLGVGRDRNRSQLEDGIRSCYPPAWQCNTI
jgi:hypothetical protein